MTTETQDANREHESSDCWCGHRAHKADPTRDYRELMCITCRLADREDPDAYSETQDARLKAAWAEYDRTHARFERGHETLARSRSIRADVEAAALAPLVEALQEIASLCDGRAYAAYELAHDTLDAIAEPPEGREANERMCDNE